MLRSVLAWTLRICVIAWFVAAGTVLVVRHVLVQRIVAAYDKYEKNRLPDERARTFTKKPDWKREKK